MKTQFYLTDIPLVLRDALEVRARTLGYSVASVVGDSLAERYGLPFDASDRKVHARFEADEYVRPNGQSVGLTMNLRLPLAVVQSVREEAGASSRTQRAIVLEQLAKTLGVELPKPRNARHGRPRGRKVAA